jgi:hypothetical protein
MNKTHIVKALNMSSGEVLTLDKATDRMEFEALPMISASDSGCLAKCECHGTDCSCNGAGTSYSPKQ